MPAHTHHIAVLGILGALLMPSASHANLTGIVPDGAQMHQIATGLKFVEGPSWNGKGVLCFSDIPANRIYRLDEEGKLSVFVEPSRNSNGTMFDTDGALLACRHDGRDVVRYATDGQMTVVASVFEGGKFNSPNDLIIAGDGAIYFTDPRYGLGDRPQEQPCEGVYRVAPDGTVTRVIDDMTRPNGIFIAPDGKTLYVADSEERKIRAYDIRTYGGVTNGRDFVGMHTDAEGVPDGMTMDRQGNVYCTGGGGIWVISPKGEHLGTIPVPEVPANCTFGGPDNKTLYITARTSVYRIDLLIPGLR